MARNTGLAFHVHHDRLVEWCSDYKERVDYIKREKPPEERTLRLRLFQLIPLNRLPLWLNKVYAELNQAKAKADADGLKARIAYLEAINEWKKADAELNQAKADADGRKARIAYLEAINEWKKADAELNQAKADAEWKKADAEWKKADAEQLHAKLCPNCPWNGQTIFPPKEKEE